MGRVQKGGRGGRQEAAADVEVGKLGLSAWGRCALTIQRINGGATETVSATQTQKHHNEPI